jgi:rare lipoprotein A
MIDKLLSRSSLTGARFSWSKAAVPCIAVLVGASLLASCSMGPRNKGGSKEYFSEKEYGVAASPRVVASYSKIPKGGGRYHVGKPYKIRGKTYRPKTDDNYSAVGLASWYGSAFHGRKTANGEIYDMGELTAAHPTLPLPSYVRVTNLANKRSVVVRINDRGPFSKGRIIDVSATVAQMLDFKKAGTAKVKVEYVGKARMDGLDRQMLVSSYKGPNDFGRGSLFASRITPKPNRTVLASLIPKRQQQKRQTPIQTPVQADRSMDLFGAQRLDDPFITAPAFMPTTFSHDDPIAPLILRSDGFTMSYAPSARPSGAHQAVSELAKAGKTTAIIQLGTFGNKANAERLAMQFDDFGKSMVSDTISQGQRYYTVRVIVDAARTASETVIAAAASAGIADAFVVSR